jgi:hypothetical protein
MPLNRVYSPNGVPLMADSRERESEMLNKCVLVGRGECLAASNSAEANVFRVAAMLLESRFPVEARRLACVCEGYFSADPASKLPAVEVIRNGWLISLPRARDLLERQF